MPQQQAYSSSAVMQACCRLEHVIDVSAAEPSTMKLEEQASCPHQPHDKEMPRTREHNPNPMNLATVEYSRLLPNIR
jgi:hypothetical protein